jgi:hypothetical protein
MKKYLLGFLIVSALSLHGQSIDEDQLGAWYMYFFNKSFEGSRFGMQGDLQMRLWSPTNDLEQILLRSGVTYRPKNADIMFTAGYANITSGVFGEQKLKSGENRIYQEALFSNKIGTRFLLTHRFRFEQRWVENQDFRTRYRYNVFLNVPLNSTALDEGVVHLAMYNEVFINGQADIGGDRTVQLFDRNRAYIGLGFVILKNLRVQSGWMKQSTANWSKGQLQFSLHHRF